MDPITAASIREDIASLNTNMDRLSAGMLTDRVEGHMTTLRNTPRAFAGVLVEWRAAREKVQRNPRLKPEAIRADVDQVRVDAIGKVTQIHNTAMAARDQVAPLLEMHAQSGPEAPDAQLAREVAATRMWARWKPLLDRSMLGVEELIDREMTNLPGLQVLLDELPDYMRARGDRAEVIDAFTGKARQYETALLPPVQRLARQLQAEIETGMTNLESARNWALAALTPYSSMEVNVLPDWPKGASIAVGAE